MSKKISSKLVYSSSEDSDGTEELHNDSDDGENSLFENIKFASSTQIESREKTNVKLELANILRSIKTSKMKFFQAAKKTPWDAIHIDGYSTEELQKHLQDIIKKTGTVRTLDEVLADYVQNHVALDCASHPEHPKKPITPGFRYLKENREKLEHQMEKANPGQKYLYHEVFSYAMKKFKALPERKREPYLKAYEDEKKAYEQAKKEFLSKYPELKAPRKKAGSKSKSYVSPFSHFRESLSGDGNVVDYISATKMWKAMPTSEKGKFIIDVVNMETDLVKKISKDEIKIMDSFHGIPKRPLAAYQMFLQKFKVTYTGSNKEFIKFASAAWKNISDSERQKLQAELDENMESWRREMEIYIRKLPKEQQPMMLSKYKLLQTDKKKNNQTKIESFLVKAEADGKKVTADSPRKKKLNGSEEATSSPQFSFISPKKRKNEEGGTDSDAPSPKKKKERIEDSGSEPIHSTNSEGSPSKKKKKKTDEEEQPRAPKVKQPVFPSQTTAHYFMTQCHDGKPNKVAKAYKKLDRQVKGKYRAAMRKEKSEFLKAMAAYLATIDLAEKATFTAKLNKARTQQAEDISWHTSAGTDVDSKKASSSSSSSSDSDSS